MRGSPLCRAKRASMATRQRGPPPQGSTASHERYDMGGATPSPCRHRHPQNPAGQNPTKGTAEGVVVAHRSRLRGGRLLPVSWIFGAGWKGLAPRNRRPPTRCGQPPPCPRLVCAVGGVGAAGNGPPRGTPPHPICCAGCLRCTCGLQIDYQGVGVIGRPPVGASGSMKASCKKAQVLGFFGGALYCYVTRLPSPHPLGG